MAGQPRNQKISPPQRRGSVGETPREYGYGIIGGACSGEERWLVSTVPQAWALASTMFGRPPRMVYHVRSLEAEVLADEVTRLPEVDAVMGIGGGAALDFAKYVAWQREIPLVLAPAVVSTDACMTNSIAVRCEGRVRYVGEVYPQRVLVDFELVCAAPPELNRAGAGNILSIHTALRDWQLASHQGIEVYNAAVAQRAYAIVAKLMAHSENIRAARPSGILTLTELLWSEVDLCRRAKSSRPEEGSEHFWTYNVEYLAKRRFVHGEIVALGTVLMSALQENDAEELIQKLDALGVRRDPEAMGISSSKLRESLLSACDYAEADHLGYSILNDRPITPALAEELIRVATRS